MIAIGARKLDIPLFESIVLHNHPVELSQDALQDVTASYKFLLSFSQGKLIYGINTGFGPMAQYRIDDDSRRQLQYNLIRSHSSGMGQLLSPQFTRALMLARLNTLLLGYSGVHADTVALLQILINNEAYPCIYAHGGVGASGDLVQLAHLALGLIGEGKYWYKNKIVSATVVFADLNMAPLKIYMREGLALLNGTSAMTGIAAINTIFANRLVIWSTLFSVIVNELMEAFDDHFSQELNAVKRHRGQQQIAEWMRCLGNGSGLMRKRDEFLYERTVTEKILEDRVQEYYSLRCVPQVLGPVLDTAMNALMVVEDELNSVNDNPVVDRKSNNIFHGGNFHGDYIALEMDKLKIAITKLSMLAERQLNFLLNPALNKKLPPFANAGILGLNFGMQGMQYPATSTVAENQALSTPLYVHSIPNNNDNQDIVSMGCNAAMACSTVIENTYEVLAVEAVTIAQCIDLQQAADKLSPAARWLYYELRKSFPFVKDDIAASAGLQDVKKWLQHTDVKAHFADLFTHNKLYAS